MAIPTGSNAQSWGTFAFPVDAGSAPVSRSLPTALVVTYDAPKGLYATCLSNDSLRVREIGEMVAEVTTVTAAVQRVTWQLLDTTAPGVVDTVFYAPREGMLIGLGDIEFYYQFDYSWPSPGQRKGLYITSESSSHLSIEPLNFKSDLKLPGDIYLLPNNLGIDPGLRLIDVDVTGSAYTGSFMTARISESIETLVSRVTESNAIFALSGLITDRGYATAVTGGVGPLVRNWDWDGGFYMVSSDDVSVYGTDKDFLLPSGSLVVRDASDIFSGSLNVESGSIYIRGPVVRFEVLGESSSAYLQGQAFVHLTQSSAPIVNVGTGEPFLADGTMVLVPDSGSTLQEMHVRADGNWYTLVSQSFDVIDAGTY